MERKKVVVDLQQIDLLEEKIVRATELIRSLRRERDTAQTKLTEAREALEALSSEHQGVERERHDLHAANEQVELLREERVAIRGKVTRMLEMMASLEETPTHTRGDH